MPEIYQCTTDHPPLEPGGVHIWRVPIDPAPAEAAELAEILSADERQRAARFHFDRHRHAYIAARSGLRRLLGRYTGAAPRDVRFRYGPQGKPELDDPPAARTIQFNISHRGALALMAFAHVPLGVDIEQLREVPQALAIARKHFTPAETRLLESAAATGASDARHCFFRLWTRKEAVIKAVGAGLSLPLNEFAVTSEADSDESWHTVRVPSRSEVTWALRDLPTAAGYCGALTIADGPAAISCWCETSG